MVVKTVPKLLEVGHFQIAHWIVQIILKIRYKDKKKVPMCKGYDGDYY